MIALRKRHPALRRRDFFRGTGPATLRPDIIWHGVEPGQPDFSADSRTPGLRLDGSQTGREPDRDFYVACNAWQEPLPFRVPPSPSGRPWRRVVDTALASPLDIVGAGRGAGRCRRERVRGGGAFGGGADFGGVNGPTRGASRAFHSRMRSRNRRGAFIWSTWTEACPVGVSPTISGPCQAK